MQPAELRGRGDPEHAPGGAVAAGRGRLGLGDLRQDAPHVGEVAPARLGEPDPPRRPRQQTGTDMRLEPGDGSGDGGRRESKRAAGGASPPSSTTGANTAIACSRSILPFHAFIRCDSGKFSARSNGIMFPELASSNGDSA